MTTPPPSSSGATQQQSTLWVAEQDDLDGACFILGSEGELEEDVDRYHILFATVCPRASPADAGNAINYTNDESSLFVNLNYLRLRELGVEAPAAAACAYLRFLAARNGLISPNFLIAEHNVRYNDARDVSDVEARRIMALTGPNSEWLIDLQRELTAPVRAYLRKHFSDLVCLVAFIFRVRGHHYTPDLKDRYEAVWARCLHDPKDLPCSFEHIATTGLHGIFPDLLDQYWKRCVDNSLCAGALTKRYDSAPAGCAGIYALERGVNDILMIFPGIPDRVPAGFQYFQDQMNKLSGNRWGGSINHRFYGVQRIRIDEAKIGVLASVVMGIYAEIASTSQLRNSPALKRLAEVAPATGGALGRMAARAIKEDAMSLLAASVANPP